GCLRTSQVDVDLRDLLRLGLYQLFLLKTAEHAAVYETVELASKRQRPTINGMLRTAGRRRNELLSRAGAQPLFVRTSPPQFLIRRWKETFDAEAAEACGEGDHDPPPAYARL